MPKADEDWIAYLMSGAGDYLRNSYDRAARGLRSIPDAAQHYATEYGRPAVEFAASALPGAGLVQGNQDFERGRKALGEGRYKDAAVNYGLGLVNAGTEFIPAMAALPPLKFVSVDVMKKPDADSLIHSMEPYVTVPVRHGDTPEDILDNLSAGYGLEHPAPKHVFEKDMQDYSQLLEDPAVLDAIRNRLDLAQKNNMIPGPDVEDSDLHFMLSADRSPDSTWAQYFGENVSPDKKNELDMAVGEDFYRRAKAASMDAAYKEYLAAGGTPTTPKARAEWDEKNPGRQYTSLYFDPASWTWREKLRFDRDPKTGEMVPVRAPLK